MKETHRKILLGVVLVLIVGAIFYLESMKANPTGIVESIIDNSEDERPALKDGVYPLAPELTGIVGYLNTDGEEIKIEDFRGKVVLIDFWTYTCINCIRTLPYLTAWDERYSDKGLVIIGVHTPEFEFEKEAENVQDAMERYNIEYRVVQDNDYATWGVFKNRYWPRKYLIDSEGYIRYDHIGEGAYEDTERMIQKLLGEIGEDVSDMDVVGEEEAFRLVPTAELYAGYEEALPRNQNIGNQEGFQEDVTYRYRLPELLDRDVIYLDGKWESNPDNLRFEGDEGSVVLQFSAKEVNIVADSEEIGMIVEVLIDGLPETAEQAGDDVIVEEERSYIVIDGPRLYNVFRGKYDNYNIELKLPDEGFSFNAFTFGG